MPLSPPKLKIGQARMAGLETGEYELHSTRVQPSERQALKEIVNEGTYENLEDLLEDATFQFLTTKPYLTGTGFLQPPAPVVSIRHTDTLVRTGWRQINIFLNKDLAKTVRMELAKIATYGRRKISISSYLYTALTWYLQTHAPAIAAQVETKPTTKVAAKPAKTNKQKSK